MKRQTWIVLLTGAAVIGALLWLRRGPSSLDRWMAAQRANGERFTLAELGLTNRPSFRSPWLEVVEAQQPALSAFHNPAGPTERCFSPHHPANERVLWREPSMESAAGFLAEWPLMQGQLEAVEPALTEVRAALGGMVLDPGGNYTGVRRQIDFVAIRHTAQVLADAVLLELRQGRTDRALTDLVSLIRLSRQHERHHHLVSQMIRVAVLGLAVNRTWQALQQPVWTDQQLALLQEELTHCALLEPMVHTIQVERALSLHWAEILAREGPAGLSSAISGRPASSGITDHLQALMWKSFTADRDQETCLRLYQNHLAAARNLANGAPWIAARATLDQLAPQEPSLTERWFGGFGVLTPVTSLTLSNHKKVLEHLLEAEARRRLAITALALERHRLRGGAYPKQLEDLEPVADLPDDPYVAAPFRYSPGSPPWLYSVGTDGRPDREWGVEETPEGVLTGGEHGSDIVWPHPLPPARETGAVR